MAFRFNNLKRLGDSFSVPLPTDDAGFLGRECPVQECEGYFKVKPGTGLKGPDLASHCPYCGHSSSANDFFTKAQIEYAKSIVLRQVTDAISRDLKQLEFNHKPRGPFGIGMSLEVKPGNPVPIRYYRDPALETHVTCASCTLEYSVFGVFAYCPDCGSHNSLLILERNLDLVAKQLQLAGSLTEEDLARHLVEDALENCVSMFDAFARETSRVRAARSSDPNRASSLSFQNIRRAAPHLKELFAIDLVPTLTADDWAFVHANFMRRHLLAHRAGVIDQQYLDATGEESGRLGRRLSVNAADVGRLAQCIASLAKSLVALLPPPQPAGAGV